MKRTHTCGELTAENKGKKVTLIGWVNKCRNLGGLLFMDLRDRKGITQAVVNPETNPELKEISQTIREEFVVSLEGIVNLRPDEMINNDMITGAIELQVTKLTVENKSKPMPFNLEDPKVDEDIRLKYRYLDMRRSDIYKNLKMRHDIAKTIRNSLSDQDFLEVETPILSKSTPEGARDYIIPSRTYPNKFFALPQAPQQYKQLLMVGGIERYFQIAKCFRDEDLRADRQPEFTQIDLEMSFVEQEDIFAIIETILKKVMKDIKNIDIPTPFPKISYEDAMNRFGSDKPDMRFALELVDLSEELKDSEFKVFSGTIKKGGIIKALNAKGQNSIASRKQIDEWTNTAKIFAAKGLAYLKMQDDGSVKSPIAKFLSEEEINTIISKTNAETGDVILIVADSAKIVNAALGKLRLEIADSANLIPEDTYNFLWVLNFPLLDYDEEEERYVAMHHPFTSPIPEDIEKLENNPANVRAQAYDVILNGVELGGGSIRIHNPDVQAKMFKTLGISDEEAKDRFGHILEAFSYGAPPHGGIALGFDRMVMLLTRAASIREVIAFPKTTKAGCLMTNSPSDIDKKQLEELKIEITD
ncbi:MAG: aspartate--tRNA ligase [Verrucomicrobiota bacterium]|nr:aspartate--tRNA ligase [Verrucomicrobiota bacterium]